MTASRQSLVSVKVILDHMAGSFTEAESRYEEILRLIIWVVNYRCQHQGHRPQYDLEVLESSLGGLTFPSTPTW
jgi:hypothetical protein